MQAVDDPVNVPAGERVGGAVPASRRTAVRRAVDAGALASYVAIALAIMGPLWRDPNNRVLTSNEDDHGIFMVLLAHAERVVFHGDNPLFNTRLNVPDGVNMMANTSIFALSLPMAPVTHVLGPAVAVVLLITVGLAGTAAGWYWVLSRHLVHSRAAAYVAGLWCGFAPTMVSHANGHVNWVSNFMLPFIVWRTLRLREPNAARRNGLVLAALVVVQVFINEELLLFTALALGVFVAAYAAQAPQAARAVARPFLTGLLVTAGAAAVVLAYPLWFQFFGPQHYRGLPFEPHDFVTDLAAYPGFARLSLAGDRTTIGRLSISPTEDNAFFGWPVLIMLAVSLGLLWRSAAARAIAITGLVFAVMSLGPVLMVNGSRTGIRLPFHYLAGVPVLDLISTTRLAVVVTVIVGILLALAADRMSGGAIPRIPRAVFWVALVAALVPVVPRPLPVTSVTPVPAFIAEEMWRAYVPAGRSLVTVPPADITTGRQAMRWAAFSLLEYPLPRGYFMGPKNAPVDRTGAWGAPRRPSVDLFMSALYGRRPRVTPDAREAAVRDLIHWRAAVVVVGDQPNRDRLRTTLTNLLGRQPVQVGGVLLWDVRDLPVPPIDGPGNAVGG